MALATNRHTLRYGEVPRIVYVGREEDRLIEQDLNLLREAGMLRPDPTDHASRRRSWNGMGIFVVDAERHLAVG